MTDQAEKDGLAQAAAATGEGSTGQQKMSTYVVQRRVGVRVLLDQGQGEHYVETFPTLDPVAVDAIPEDAGGDVRRPLWEDIGIVEVPVRSQRKTAVSAALEKFAVGEHSHPSMFRALGDDEAEEIPVTLDQPPAPPAVVKVGR